MTASSAHCWRRIGVYGGDHSCERLKSEIHCRNCAVFREAARGLLQREMTPLPPLSSALEATRDSDSRSVLAFRLGSESSSHATAARQAVAQARQSSRAPAVAKPAAAKAAAKPAAKAADAAKPKAADKAQAEESWDDF